MTFPALQHPDRVLTRAPRLGLVLGDRGVVEITIGDATLVTSAEALTILRYFDRPRPIAEVVDTLGERCATPEEWARAIAVLNALVGAGALVDENEPPAAARQPGGTAFPPRAHAAMLDDRARTTAFLRAIEATVTSKDVVVDIGTGSGILALAAARAGARHVYAIEATDAAEAASAAARDNGLQDRITVIRGWSTRVTLPEPATVLVTETIGVEPLEEAIEEITADAHRRLLAPGARMIPAAVESWAVPVQLPESVRMRHVVPDAAAARWNEWYDFDLSSLVRLSMQWSGMVGLRPEDVPSIVRLGPPVRLWRSVLAKPRPFPGVVRARVAADVGGQLDGVVLWSVSELSAGSTLDASPWASDRTTSWGAPVWLGNRATIRRGDELEIEWSRGAASRVRVYPTA